MASSVFFKFKSQKEAQRIEFDGTGISVFEVKSIVIKKSGLGDGTDFDLAIYTEDGSEEYDDDTTIIPRSTTVIARRLPASKPGAGRAARYVTGKMPVAAKSSRKDHHAKASSKLSDALTQMQNAMTEEERMEAMFQAQSEQLSAQQEEMSHHPGYRSNAKKMSSNAPDHEPPPGYLCHRCGQAGHWIKKCPTNGDSTYDNRVYKRITGIPRSFLKAIPNPGADGDENMPSAIASDGHGGFFIVESDKSAWEKFQEQTKSSSEAAKTVKEANKEIEDKGLACPIDQKMLIDPMKTPCCKKSYCNDCITNALMESDFVCPNCNEDGVLIEDLAVDKEMAEKIKDYLTEKDSKAQAAESSKETLADAKGEERTKSPTPTKPTPKSPSATVPAGSAASPRNPDDQEEKDAATSGQAPPKKRPAEDELENPKIPKGPKAMINGDSSQPTQPPMMPGMPSMPMMPSFPGMPMMPPFPGMPMMNGFPMGMPMNMPDMMGMMNPMNAMEETPSWEMNGGGRDGYHPPRHRQRRPRPRDYREL